MGFLSVVSPALILASFVASSPALADSPGHAFVLARNDLGMVRVRRESRRAGPVVGRFDYQVYPSAEIELVSSRSSADGISITYRCACKGPEVPGHTDLSDMFRNYVIGVLNWSQFQGHSYPVEIEIPEILSKAGFTEHEVAEDLDLAFRKFARTMQSGSELSVQFPVFFSPGVEAELTRRLGLRELRLGCDRKLAG